MWFFKDCFNKFLKLTSEGAFLVSVHRLFRTVTLLYEKLHCAVVVATRGILRPVSVLRSAKDMDCLVFNIYLYFNLLSFF